MKSVFQALAYQYIMYDYWLIKLYFENIQKTDLLELEVCQRDKAAALNMLCFLRYGHNFY